jgi:biopolymer transport protein ExbD
MITIKTAKKQKLKESKGITLIALVITIIVLLILAGVTIATLTGDNGILKKAGDAKTQTEQAKEDENLKIAIAGSYGTDGKLNLKDLKDNLTNQGIDYDKNNTGFPLEVKVNGEKKKIDANGNIIESIQSLKTKGTVFKDTTTLEDTYGNQVKIPKGFKIANDSATDVTGGIVIEDATYTNTIGSQFVWIPVGTGENAIKKANKEKVDIALGRYEFTKTTSEYSGSSFTEDTTANHNSDYKNAIAKDIEQFKTSVKNNHGYYIGRYEAGVVDYNSSVSTSNSDYKINWTGYTGDNIKLVCKKEQQVWNYVTQNKASELSRNMYGSEAKVTSDLINSYAWDTAIVFVQKCGKESNSSTYSRTWGHSSITEGMPQATGTNILTETSKVDKQCNIFDMAGNCLEWTTETYSSSNGYRRTLRFSRR